ncbi:hypothetical protein JTE90_013138 [Oedothorax gibbosus]|uniref:DDE-1 domain-containing protein n=1 Tax=Oedothorax gibbosus TaxID=931172 RepID=A0AAV6VJZ5_9ARAC|nr:hypothetical protein JTE90_013138 [Oedothorax gibbosus]
MTCTLFIGKWSGGATTPSVSIHPHPCRKSKSVADAAGDEDWGIGHSENGWMTSEVFYDVLQSGKSNSKKNKKSRKR